MSTFPFPFFRLEIDKNGQAVHPEQTAAVIAELGKGSITDLFVMSHGWNNDEAEAQDLYDRMFGKIADALENQPGLAIKKDKSAVVGVFWPSKKFADRDLIPGNAAGLADLDSLTDEALNRAIDNLQEFLEDPNATAILETARAQLNHLDDPTVQNAWTAKLQSVLPRQIATTDAKLEGTDQFLAANGEDLFNQLNRPLLDDAPTGDDQGGAADFDDQPQGEAAGLGDILGGIEGAALKILNLTTYYCMKDRAATVGHGALNASLSEIQRTSPNVRIHLMGHSFGARVVTSAAQGPAEIHVQSMSLLQAAFSHYAFSQQYDEQPQHVGFFRDVIVKHRIKGPILITHTVLDKAVGIAYAIASRIANQVASGLGGPDDIYGGLGRNGAQKTEGTQDLTLLTPGQAYQFQSGGIYNLNGDAVIIGHSEIDKPEVAYAVLVGAGVL